MNEPAEHEPYAHELSQGDEVKDTVLRALRATEARKWVHYHQPFDSLVEPDDIEITEEELAAAEAEFDRQESGIDDLDAMLGQGASAFDELARGAAEAFRIGGELTTLATSVSSVAANIASSLTAPLNVPTKEVVLPD
jgi:hypothetical protein